MANYVSNQAGDATVSANWTPNGVPGAGDTIDVQHAITNFSGLIGDDTATPAITLSAGGTLTLSGDIETRSTASGIHWNTGSLVAGSHNIVHAPTVDGSSVATFGTTGTHSMTAVDGSWSFSTARGATSCLGVNKADSVAYLINFDWGSMRYENIGLGSGVLGLTLAMTEADVFNWNGGRYLNNGRLLLNFTQQQITAFAFKNMVIGLFQGTYGWDANDSIMRVHNLRNDLTVPIDMVNNLYYSPNSDLIHNMFFTISGLGRVDMTGSSFVNVKINGEGSNLILDNSWNAITAGSVDTSFGLSKTVGTPHLSCNGLSILGDVQSGTHVPSFGGDGTEFVINDLIVDGCNVNTDPEVGDQPVIGTLVTLNNPVFIWGGGGINPSLNNFAHTKINVNRGTFHEAANILYGEGADPQAHIIGAIKNCIFSAPYSEGYFAQGGGLGQIQTTEDVNYNAFIETEMGATNTTHTTLGGNGYFRSDVGTDISYGVNDFHVTDFQFADSTRHAVTWANSLGYAATLAGLGAAILAGYGIDLNGNDITVDGNATHANYRTYIQEGYTPYNALLQGAGEAGVDIGAFDYSAPVINQTATVAGITGGENLTDLDYAVFAGHDLSTMTLLTQGTDASTDANGDLVIDLAGETVNNGDPLIIVIGDWTTAPTGTSRAAVCYANASVG